MVKEKVIKKILKGGVCTVMWNLHHHLCIHTQWTDSDNKIKLFHQFDEISYACVEKSTDKPRFISTSKLFQAISILYLNDILVFQFAAIFINKMMP